MSANNVVVALLAIIGLTLVSPADAMLFSWFCNAGNCASGSCSFQGNITEGVCSNAPDGSGMMIKANCAVNPTVNQQCVSVSVWGPASVMPNGLADCVLATQATETFPAGMCLPWGPNGMPMMFTVVQGLVNFSYACNEDCSACETTAQVSVSPAEVAGYYAALVSTFSCPIIIPYQKYDAGSACENAPLHSKYYIPGLNNCNGYVGNSNAKANLFSCV